MTPEDELERRGKPLSEWLDSSDPIVLTPEGSKTFVDALLNPKEPNEKLKELVRKSREKYPNLWQPMD